MMRRTAGRPRQFRRCGEEDGQGDGEAAIEVAGVRLTHPDRVLDPGPTVPERVREWAELWAGLAGRG